ncbi:DUF721 domain-containing protein [Desulfobulbus rhabdoformis]|uniref:DUF721 domain-containing protein n=1 Tax=Desulfobulbus rhabdoformis TaxID=34032 RepID=UPI0019651F4E|nr:DUF721 domain-containing protein [Desulfobulbus rhabdoformis]MBM9615521.1 DUF721 domain-containing protein [Desulfobulbus rhabdoformis]
MIDDRDEFAKKDPATMADLLPSVYSKKEWKKQWRLFHLERRWATIVGREVGRLTMPAFFRQNTLWIYVQDSAWMHHLQYIKLDLMTRINKALEDDPITDIRWQLQPKLPTVPERSVPAAHAVDPKSEENFQQMTGCIANEECREALQRLWHLFAAHSDDESP